MTSQSSRVLLVCVCVAVLSCVASALPGEYNFPYTNVAALAPSLDLSADVAKADDNADLAQTAENDEDTGADDIISVPIALQGSVMDDDHHHHPEPEPGEPMMHMMAMWFHFSATATILFEGWAIDGAGGLIGSMIGLAVISFLYEGLKVFRDEHRRRMIKEKGGAIQMLSVGHMIQSLLHMVQIWVGMCLMLVFMTYNVWLCLAVTVGGGCGYFVFAWMGQGVASDRQEYCH